MTGARLGFGVSGPLGQKWFSENAAHALIEAALTGGVAHFDTAPFYFDAEARLGAALARAGRADAFVSTKTGTRREGMRLVKDFSEQAIRADVERSLKRLSRRRLDLLYLHGPTAAEIDAARPVLAALTKEGKIDRSGVCGDGAPLIHAIEAGFDAIMAVYNVLDHRNAVAFARAKEKSVMTVAVAPLAQGLLDARFYAPASLADIWRLARAAFKGRYRARDIKAVKAAAGDADPAAVALRFVLANPDIDIVMTTTTRREHLAQSIAAAMTPNEPRLHARLVALALDRPRGGA